MHTMDYSLYEETKLHGRAALPYNTYLCTIPLDFTHVPLHWHAEMECIYIKKGKGCVTVDGQPYSVDAGCIVVVAPGRLHAIEGMAGRTMEYENIIFSLSMLETNVEDWCAAHCFAPLHAGGNAWPVLVRPADALHASVARCLDEADTVCAACPPGYPLLLKSHLYALLYALHSARGQSVQETRGRDTDKIKLVLAYVEEHCARPISVEEIAGVCCFSPSHFMKFFKAATGKPFVEYCNDYRLTLAARALMQSAAPVLEIAGAAGFDNVSYFNRCFKRKYGVSPRTYRAAAVQNGVNVVK